MSASEPPRVTRVAIAVVESEGAYVVGVRGPDGPLPGYHEFPGGKLHHDESPFQAAVRECEEETGLTVTADETLYECTHDYPHGRIELTFVLCRPVATGRPAALGRFEWRTSGELSSLKFPEANEPVVKLLMTRR
jgi:8-oxo-dGTP diphosphatase